MAQIFFIRRKRRMLLCVASLLGALLQVYLMSMDDPQTSLARINLDNKRRILASRLTTYKEYESRELNRTGPGEGGEPVAFSEAEQRLILKEMKEEGFSRYVNDRVSLDRGLKDYRPDVCRAARYHDDLPSLSVVIIFCNELLRVVLRTVHSVVNRTPPHLLRDVILVDDASSKPELGSALEDQLEQWPAGLVQLVRLHNRSGLIRARMAGVRAAAGDAVVMMDAHMEASRGWAEPLLYQIKKNNRSLVAPTIDIIEAQTLKYSTMPPNVYQSFKWSMEFSWQDLHTEQPLDPLQPIPTHALVGCIMGMNRRVFLEMGGFDEALEFWGTENLELPFRIWMCGGRVEIIPCSRVAHTYRFGFGVPWKGKGDYFTRNAQRVAEVWLDEYKEQYYLLHPELEGGTNFANISQQLELKKKLGCKGFQWFLDEIVQTPKFMYNKNVIAWGKIQTAVGSLCLDTLGASPYREGELGVYPCYTPRGHNQLFSLTTQDQLRREDFCVRYQAAQPRHNVTLSGNCDPSLDNRWHFQLDSGWLVHERTGWCLDTAGGVVSGSVTYLLLHPCQHSYTQTWIWEHYVGT